MDGRPYDTLLVTLALLLILTTFWKGLGLLPVSLVINLILLLHIQNRRLPP